MTTKLEGPENQIVVQLQKYNANMSTACFKIQSNLSQVYIAFKAVIGSYYRYIASIAFSFPHCLCHKFWEN